MPRVHHPERIFLSDTIDLCVQRGVEIRLRCSNHLLAGDCGHQVVMPAAELAALCTKRGWPRQLIEIGEHLRCSVCGWAWPHVKVVGQ